MKKRNKIISLILGLSLFISSFKLEFKGILNKDKIETSKNETTTSTIDNIENNISEPTIKIDDEIYETTIENEITENIEEIEIINKTENTIVETETQIDIEFTQPTTNQIESNTTPTEPQPTEIENIEIIPNIKLHKNEMVKAITNVNIRSSNTTKSLKIGNLKLNESAIKILSCNNNWTLVKTSDQIGYVCNDYITSSNSYIESEYIHTKQNDIALTSSELNIRDNPNTDANIIKTFEKNTELEVIAKVDNGWLLVKNNGIIGYVHGDYTTSILESAKKQYPELNIKDLDIIKIVQSTSDNLNIRTNNNTESKIIRQLDKNESIRVLDEYGDWYFIMTNEYEFGFVNKNYTETLEGIFVIVDISKQRVYLYNNNELYLIGFITTGKSSTPSDIGLFSIWYKGTDEEIIPGYLVHFWMPYNLAYEGLHDAENWRKYGYGTDNYINNGSNGCINMLYEDAKIIYENVSIGTKVLVHK